MTREMRRGKDNLKMLSVAERELEGEVDNIGCLHLRI
jgi:hypothetical protein